MRFVYYPILSAKIYRVLWREKLELTIPVFVSFTEEPMGGREQVAANAPSDL